MLLLQLFLQQAVAFTICYILTSTAYIFKVIYLLSKYMQCLLKKYGLHT